MAKVDTIELNIGGRLYSYNINVGKAGIFRCKIDWKVAEALGLSTSSLEFKTLQDLKNAIIGPYKKYLDANTIEELIIRIQYQSSGYYAYNKDGRRMFNNTSIFNSRGFSTSIDNMAFEFDVLIKETSSTGVVIWYETVQLKEEGADTIKYQKDRQSSKGRGVFIPYSQEAIYTLEKAREGIRAISNILHDVLSKETEKIEAILVGGNLLNQKNE